MEKLPILILTFNRIEGADKLLSSLRLYQPSLIYIASDGPRGDRPGECEDVLAVRKYIEGGIDWDCQIKTLYRKSNLGCKVAVNEAVQWFFHEVPKGIVLEDDCIPNVDFYQYCEVMLSRYQNDFSVGTITGRNELGFIECDAITFSSKFICWGWASWASRVLDVDVEYGYKKDDKLLFSSNDLVEYLHINSMRGGMLTKQVNSWAFSYDFSFRKKKQLCIVPRYNMVENVGFGELGTHSSSRLSDGVPIGSDESIDYLNSNYIKPKVNVDYVKRYILFLYPYPKLMLLSCIKYLYRFRSLYRFFSNFGK
ncbi:hypothetical protein A9261_18850 [Vibrio tasmaniensis]|nr:hypothetical protein A9261_18850 [Vibrio tasmaniensis]